MQIKLIGKFGFLFCLIWWGTIATAGIGLARLPNQQDGWRFVRSDGSRFRMLAVDHVTYNGVYASKSQTYPFGATNDLKYASKTEWETETLSRLKSWGFNCLGVGADATLLGRGSPHTLFAGTGAAFVWASGGGDRSSIPMELSWAVFPNVFHPNFKSWVEASTQGRCSPNRDNDSLIGYYLDNELAWRQDGTKMFDCVAALDGVHEARQALDAFLAERHVSVTNATRAVKLEFLELLAEQYFSTVVPAVRKADPNHLVLGCRFMGVDGADSPVWRIAGRWCDAISINIYPYVDLETGRIRVAQDSSSRSLQDALLERYVQTGKPILVTEWSFCAYDSGLPCTAGAGQRFSTQRERVDAARYLLKALAELPFVVGYSYFMWVDDPCDGASENSNYGLVRMTGEPYAELVEMFTEFHRRGFPPEVVGLWRMSSVR